MFIDQGANKIKNQCILRSLANLLPFFARINDSCTALISNSTRQHSAITVADDGVN
jgi:hypothetical protein